MKALKNISLPAILVVLAVPTLVEAQLKLRVSVKVVLDEGGNRAVDDDAENDGTFPGCCDLNTDEEIRGKIADANAILNGIAAEGIPRTEERGYNFDLVDIIDLYDLPTPPDSVRACSNDDRHYCGSDNDCKTCSGGPKAGHFCDDSSDCEGHLCLIDGTCLQVDHWFHAPIQRVVRNAIRDEARATPASKLQYGWDDEAVNIYILGTDGSGTAYDNILLGQDLKSLNTPFHELGHFFNILHSFGTDSASDSCDDLIDDEVDDTLIDNSCWTLKDQIANANFPVQCSGPCDYPDLDPPEQKQVDQVYYNVMCYRGTRDVLTPGQLDRLTDFANGDGNHVATGRTRFVDGNNTGALQIGSSRFPIQMLAGGLSLANPGDIVLLRADTYPENLTIDADVILRASKGDAIIGELP